MQGRSERSSLLCMLFVQATIGISLVQKNKHLLKHMKLKDEKGSETGKKNIYLNLLNLTYLILPH